MTDLTTALEDLVLLLLIALIPALAWLGWIRRTERGNPEPWGRLLSAFGWGAVIATIVAGILEAILIAAGTALDSAYPQPEFNFLQPSSPWNLFFVVLVIAPLVEEGLKAGGVARSLGPIRVLADGPVVGAAVGLGFGFFETFLYGVGAFAAGGIADGIVLILVRSISSVLLHGSSTAMFGYGYARGRITGQGGWAGAYYLLAVLMHASFNLLASLGAFLPLVGITFVDATLASLIGLALTVGFAGAALSHVRTLIETSNYPGASGAHPAFRAPPVRRRSS